MVWETLLLCVESLYSMKSGSMLQILDVTEGPSTLPFPALAQIVMLHRIRRRFQDKKTSSILDLLASYPVVGATDPRDRIFALRGVNLEANTKTLSPDYSCSVREVYMNATWHALHSEKPFRLFPFAGLALSSVAAKVKPILSSKETIPTWVADWENLHELPQMTPVSTQNSIPGFQASRNTKAKLTTGAEPDILKVKVMLLDKVSKIATIAPTTKISTLLDSSYKLAGNEFKVFKDEFLRHDEAVQMAKIYVSDPYVDGTPCAEAFWRTMICDTTRSRPAEFEFGTWYTRIYGELKIIHETDFTIMDGSGSESGRASLHMVISTLRLFETLPTETLDLLEFLNLLSRPDDDTTLYLSLRILMPLYKDVYRQMIEKRSFGHLTGGIVLRQFAVTEKGYMALVPVGTQVRDATCVFYGAETPFLLRRKPRDAVVALNDEPERWELVGEAYVHGFMYGKGLDLGLEPEWFDII
jgi:hypothetical protein